MALLSPGANAYANRNRLTGLRAPDRFERLDAAIHLRQHRHDGTCISRQTVMKGSRENFSVAREKIIFARRKQALA
jgi:hypothetical protein